MLELRCTTGRKMKKSDSGGRVAVGEGVADGVGVWVDVGVSVEVAVGEGVLVGVFKWICVRKQKKSWGM